MGSSPKHYSEVTYCTDMWRKISNTLSTLPQAVCCLLCSRIIYLHLEDMLYHTFWCIRIVSIWVVCLLWHHRAFVKHVCVFLRRRCHLSFLVLQCPRVYSARCLLFLLSSYLPLLIYCPSHTFESAPPTVTYTPFLYHSLFKLHPLNSCAFLVHVYSISWQTLWSFALTTVTQVTQVNTGNAGKHTQVFHRTNHVVSCLLHVETRNCILHYIHTVVLCQSCVPSPLPFAALKWLNHWIILSKSPPRHPVLLNYKNI